MEFLNLMIWPKTLIYKHKQAYNIFERAPDLYISLRLMPLLCPSYFMVLAGLEPATERF